MAFHAVILGLYFLVLGLLGIYGLHRSYLVYLYMKYRHQVRTPPPPREPLPRVTVQLPVYNERYVVERLIDAVGRLDYPPELLDVQVLDDSTDDTRRIAARACARLAAAGVAVEHVCRETRAGFKAGALAEGLARARGDFIGIFDADFVPPPDFLRRTLGAFADPAVGLVQARWAHLNESYSMLTRVQALLLDAHFVLEHGSRSRAGRFFNFNGTAGVWRKAAIESAGGWHADTLTEDLDLSYRAQLAGWTFVFLPDVEAPAELPVTMNAFKAQQHRWARGSVQTGRKLLPQVFRSRLPWPVKIEAAFHLTANLNYVLMLALALLLAPAMYVRHRTGWHVPWVDAPLFVLGMLSLVAFYALSQRAVHADWRSRLRYLPALLAVGVGLAVNNSRAVVGAFARRPADFHRTPKYAIIRPEDSWVAKQYREAISRQPLVELAIGVYLTAASGYLIAAQLYPLLPFLALFQIGFLYTGLLSVIQQHRGRRLFSVDRAVQTAE